MGAEEEVDNPKATTAVKGLTCEARMPYPASHVGHRAHDRPPLKSLRVRSALSLAGWVEVCRFVWQKIPRQSSSGCHTLRALIS